MDRYPPIADHGLVGDLQTTALVSSQGVIDWFAAPRFDSRASSALLRPRRRRLLPPRARTPRRHLETALLPGHRHRGDPLHVARRSRRDRRPHAGPAGPDGDQQRHSLVRVVRSVRGTVRFTLECRPRFDYARAAHDLDLTQQADAGAGRPSGLPGRPPTSRAASRSNGTGRTSEAPSPSTPGRRRSWCSPSLRAGRGAPPPTVEGTTEDLLGEHRLLAEVGAHLALPRPLEQDMVHRFRDHPQAPHLRPRHPGRRRHHGTARAGRRRAQLGLPLHLGAGRLPLGAGPARPRLRGGGHPLHPLAGRPPERPRGSRRRTPPDHVPGRR